MWPPRFLLSAGLAWLYCVALIHRVQANPTSDLQQVQREFFDWHMEQSPEFATYVGINTYNDRLQNLSPSAFDTRLAAVQSFINRTQAIDRSQLNQQNQYSYDIFLDTLSTFSSNYVWRTYGSLNPVTFLEGFYLDLDYIINVTPFNTKGDFENFIARLEAYPAQITQMIERMDEAVRYGTTYHMVSVKSVPSQISKVVDTPVQESTLYGPFNKTLDGLAITQTERDDVRTRAQTALQRLWTSLRGLKTYFERTYFQHTRGTYGVGGLPLGGNYYRACLKWHLSVDMSPAQVHQKGLDEVARIVHLMHAIMNKQGFNGTIREYYNHLKADSRFHFSSAEEIMKAYEDLIYNRITPKLPQLFKDIPPGKVIVKPLSYDGPYGMYAVGSEDGSRPGIFYVNLFRPEDTSSFSMVSLTLHETIPGHHLQGIYQLASDLPGFQKFIEYSDYYAVPYHFPFYTAYTEGWALYAEYLGEEMGVYADDYELMGRYGDEIFRACRLVVDTGLHFFGWTRDRAVQYLKEHTAMPDAEVEIEIDRYITWPGQACAYKIGELKIKELRERAATSLGNQFDVRDFHSLLLDHGPVPLNVMENIVNDYIHNVHSGGSPIG